MLKMKRVLTCLLAAVLMLTLVACGSSGDKGGTGGGKDTITIYDGQFAEMNLIHQMVKLLVEEHTDAKVVIKEEMAPPASYNEILRGSADLMNCYDGTLLTTFLHLDPADVPEGQSLYDFVNERGAEKGVRLLDKMGFNNTYIMAVPMSIAEQYNLNTTSDLIPVAGELVFGAEHDFFTEEGSAKYNPLVEFYGLKFKDRKQIDINLKYSAIDNGNLDVTVAYATDARNRQSDMKLLADDRNFFPEYNGALLVRTDLFDRLSEAAPNLEEVLNKMGGIFTNEDMINLCYEVDMEGRDAAEVAKEYLQSLGLIP